MKTTTDDKTLSTADFAAAAERREPPREVRREGQEAARDTREVREMGDKPEAREMRDTPAAREMREMRGAKPAAGAEPRELRSSAAGHQDEQLAPLFLPQIAEQFRLRWDEVQIGFVDDPTQAVRKADELVAQVMKNLAETFSTERANFEGQLDQTDTEHMRVALRRYRSFFQRLLSL
jgi:hypothetical protein